jgi:hypothetical protein
MDSEVETFRAWFAYLADTRRGYLETLAKLPPAELTRDRGASHPTLLDGRAAGTSIPTAGPSDGALRALGPSPERIVGPYLSLGVAAGKGRP